MKSIKSILSVVVAVILLSGCDSAPKSVRFEPTVESLRQYECPEWFRDAKFGIWSCWNAYTVPGQGDWYARNMYMEGSRAYNYHCKTYGHPSEFGYKDVVDLWKGENFNPKEQVKLFEEAGAKYFIVMANHHDNFDLWDSEYQPWNSVNYGPKRNIIKEWYEAMESSSMRWGLTSHLERTWSWFQVAKLADKDGKYKGVPYDGVDPNYEQIYLPADPLGDTSGSQPINATPWWREHWLNRCVDLIDKYHPDLFYVDGGVPFPGEDQGATGLKMLAHLYNHNASRHDGQNEAVMCLKNWYHVAPKGEWGFYWDGIGTLDFERTRSSEILAEPWQTDTYLGAWTWTPYIKYRSAEQLIKELVDVVSKNGNLLLNVSPRPDGTLDDEATCVLKNIGGWMAANGESIYGTRPWLIAGCDDLRVVKKDEKEDLIYISSLVPIKGDNLLIPFLAVPNGAKIDTITELSTGVKLSFEQSDEGVVIGGLSPSSDESVRVFKIEGKRLQNYDVERFKSVAKRDIKQEITIWQEASYQDESASDFGAIAYDKDGSKWCISASDTLCSFIGDEVKKYPYQVQDIDFTVSGYSGFATVAGELYFGKSGDWVKVAGLSNISRLSISEAGTVWCTDKDMSVWRVEMEGKPQKINTFKSVDVACGEGNIVVLVDEIGRIRFLDGVKSGGEAAGVKITRVDYSPKTNHLIAIYDGEVAIFKDGEWLFTGNKATEVSSGKVNDDEIIGWVAQ